MNNRHSLDLITNGYLINSENIHTIFYRTRDIYTHIYDIKGANQTSLTI